MFSIFSRNQTKNIRTGIQTGVGINSNLFFSNGMVYNNSSNQSTPNLGSIINSTKTKLTYDTYNHAINIPQQPLPNNAVIVTRDLIIYLNPSSYPGSGDTWLNVGDGGSSYDGTLDGGRFSFPTFDSSDPKSFVFTRHLLDTSVTYLNYNYVSIPRPPTIGDDFTFVSWIKTTDVGYGITHYQLMNIASSETPGTVDDFGFGLNDSGELCYGDGKTSGLDITVNTTVPVNTGDWTFVAVTREKATGAVKLYINGSLNNTGTCNAGNTVGVSTILIASESDSTGYTWGGNISLFMAYTSILTDAEILQNYNAQKSYYGL